MTQRLPIYLRLVIGVGLRGDSFSLDGIHRLHVEAEGYHVSRQHVLEVEYDLSSSNIISFDQLFPLNNACYGCRDRREAGGDRNIQNHHPGLHVYGRIKLKLHRHFDHVVDFNLSESGAYPITVRELLEEQGVIEEVLATRLDYPQANGIIELRDNIAALYPGSTRDHVLVTVGCAEANFLAMQTLLSPGDEIVLARGRNVSGGKESWRLSLCNSSGAKLKLTVFQDTSSDTYTDTITITKDYWYYVGVTASFGALWGTASLYLDGILRDSATASGDATSNKPDTIYCGSYGSDAGTAITYDFDEVNVGLNVLDREGRGIDGLYLTVLGTSADTGDSGQVGRGNNVIGVIPLNRPMSSEAAAGKNPVSHVGKIYNLLSYKIAGEICQRVSGVKETYVWLVSAIGQPIDKPAVCSAQVIPADGVSLDEITPQIQEVIASEFDRLDEFCMDLANGKVNIK